MESDADQSGSKPTSAAHVRATLRESLARGSLVRLDGATGTELERRGYKAGLPLWSTHSLLDAPEAVAEIHADYARAGADILTANTFRTQRRTLERAAHSRPGRTLDDAELTAQAVGLARRGARTAGQPIWIAGSAPPLEDCYRPDRVPENATLRREHARHMENLAAAEVDLALVETMNTAREALIACEAALRCDLPLLVSFIAGPSGQLLSGERLEDAIEAVEGCDPLAVLVNCLPPSAVAGCLPALQASGLPFGIYANLGVPDPDGSFKRSESCAANQWVRFTQDWMDAGAQIIGGCCGTTPEHILATRDTAPQA